MLLIGTLVLALIAGLVAIITITIGTGDDKDADRKKAAAITQQTWLGIGADPASKEASWLTLFSWDRKARRGFVLYLPRTTLVEMPGYGGGPEAVGKALSFGGEELQVGALSNLLGVGFEHSVTFSPAAIPSLADASGGLVIDVPEKLSKRDGDGRVRTVFSEGSQKLDGAGVAEYLSLLDEAGDEIGRGARHAQVWAALFDHYRVPANRSSLAADLDKIKDQLKTKTEIAAVSSFFTKFGGVPERSVVFETLPVEPQGVETGAQYYRPNAESTQRLIERYLAGSRPHGAGEPGRRIQILNGNGIPGVGGKVAEVLVPKGFRVVLDGNAKNFEYSTTQILVYSSSKDALAVGAEIRDILGVGEVVVSRQRQTVVDVTVVVGKDYPKG